VERSGLALQREGGGGGQPHTISTKQVFRHVISLPDITMASFIGYVCGPVLCVPYYTAGKLQVSKF